MVHTQALKRPLLPSHYSVWFEPPDEAGDEVLHIVSERRTLKLKGYAFREFHERVVPLLDGSRSLEEIQSATADVFRAEDLAECLALLEAQGVLVEAPENGLPPAALERMAPQINLFHDLAPDRQLQPRLSAATVALIGLGGAGPSAATALAAAGVCRSLRPTSTTPPRSASTPSAAAARGGWRSWSRRPRRRCGSPSRTRRSSPRRTCASPSATPTSSSAASTPARATSRSSSTASAWPPASAGRRARSPAPR